jgi:hypothetical protein
MSRDIIIAISSLLIGWVIFMANHSSIITADGQTVVPRLDRSTGHVELCPEIDETARPPMICRMRSAVQIGVRMID